MATTLLPHRVSPSPHDPSIQREGVAPGALAIDRPSDKMLSFYKKRFSLSAPIKQVLVDWVGESSARVEVVE